MPDLRSRRTWRPPTGRLTVLRGRARLLVGTAVALTLGVGVLTVFGVGAAYANAPMPVSIEPAQIVQNANGTVSVTITGTWVWAYSAVLETPGIKATAGDQCDHRAGGGYGWAWFDPDDPGYSETWTGHGLYVTLGMGSTGVIPANREAFVSHDPAHPCGNFVLTNSPAAGDGYDTDTVTATHIYQSMADLPPVACMVTWDLGLNIGRISQERFTNHDNSVRWSLKEHNAWAETPSGPNCTKVGNGAPPPATTPAPAPKKVTVSKSTPPAKTPAPAPVVKPSGTLAFTGFGAIGRLTTVLGAALVLIGLLVYFFDLRLATVWLFGRGGRSWASSASRGTWFADRRAEPPKAPARRDAAGARPPARAQARAPGAAALSSTRWGSRGRFRDR